jgi:glucose/arabinose dehydrogenase
MEQVEARSARRVSAILSVLVTMILGSGVVATIAVVPPALAAVPGAPNGVPSYLGVETISPTSVRIRWADHATNELGFLVYRVVGSTSTPVPGCATNTPDLSECIDTGLTPGTYYQYYVYVWNNVASSYPGTYMLAHTTAALPSAPTVTYAVATGPNSVRVGWIDGATNETAYQVKRYSGGSYSPLPVNLPPNTESATYTDPAMSTASAQVFVVTAINTAGETYSDTYIYSAPKVSSSGTLSAPTVSSVSAVSATSATVNWVDNASNESGYLVYRLANGTSTLVPGCSITTPGLTTCTDTGLTAGTYAQFYVYAWNATGTGFSGAPIVVHTPNPLGAPVFTSSFGTASNSLSLNWQDNATDETGYNILEYVNGTLSSVATTAPNETTITLTGLAAESIHVYLVAAIRDRPDGTDIAYSTSGTWATTTAKCVPDSGTTVALAPFVSGLTLPVGLNSPNGDPRMFVVEQTGKIRLIKNRTLVAAPYLDLGGATGPVLSGGERGLLGIAFHPQFTSNGKFYVNFTRQPDGATVIAEFTAAPGADMAPISSRRDLMVIGQPFSNHNGGGVEFGNDNKLYIGMGDGGSGGDPQGRAQNNADLLGKMLRIDVDTRTRAKPYGIPSDNPFATSADGVNDPRPEIWHKGLRNPFRFTFDRANGDLYIGDVGQAAWEEVDYSQRQGGTNWGWNSREGAHCFLPTTGCPVAGLTDPIIEHAASTGWRSITGGQVYRGECFPNLVGQYFYGDYLLAEMWAFGVVAGAAQNDRRVLSAVGSITAIHADSAGEMYVVTHDGQVRRIVVG